MMSSAWTRTNRSFTLTATWSRRSFWPAIIRTSRSSWSAERLGLAPALAGPRHRLFEPRRLDRLQHVVDGVDLERLDGALVEGGDEDHGEVRFPLSSSRRATSKPVSPGICTSRKATSGVEPGDVLERLERRWPPGRRPRCRRCWPSRKHNSSRASCSSSATTAVSEARWPSRGDLLAAASEHGNLDAGAGALAGRAREREAAGGAVEHAQPLVDVAQADAARQRVLQPLVGDAEAVVFDLDDRQCRARGGCGW